MEKITKLSPIIVFGYDFPHVKTKEFLDRLHKNQYKNIFLVAAPFQKLNHNTNPVQFPRDVPHPSEICNHYEYSYFSLEHSDVEKIKEIVSENNIEIGIISGARILKKDIIDLFAGGVINFHPGKLPETAGLDAMYYTIKHNVPAGVTAHFIDSRVDAGNEIGFFPVEIDKNDNLDYIKKKLMEKQFEILPTVLNDINNGIFSKIEREHKNLPLLEVEKEEILNSFEKWKEIICHD